MCIDVLNGMADTIVELERKLAEREWIPVSERLPEKPGKYLVFYHGMLNKDNIIDLMWYGKPLMPNREVSKRKKYFYRGDAE